jgi:hypothetical protein
MILVQIDPKFIEYQKDLVVKGLADWPLALMGASIAVGFLTMAIVELVKLATRIGFNRSKVERWLYGDDIPFAEESAEISKKIESDMNSYYLNSGNHDSPRGLEHIALNDLLMLSTAGHAQAFYSLPIENLCGQISVGIQTAFESPGAHRALLYFLLGGRRQKSALLKDFSELLAIGNVPSRSSEEGEEEFEPGKAKSDEEIRLQRFMALRSKIASVIQRNVDALQINTAYSWKKLMRWYSLTFSFILAALSVLLFSEINFITAVIVVVITGYAGSFVASLIKDLYAVVESYKK